MEKKISSKGVFAVLLLASVITSTVSTIMGSALPVVMSEFGIAASEAQLVTSLYSLVSGIMILATAFVVKKFPTKNIFFVGIGLFTLGTLLCALSPAYWVLLAGRVVQGIGYGLIISMTQMVILIVIPKERRGYAMGIYGLAVTLAPVVAPMLAGLVIDHWGWRLLFYIILVICIIDIILGVRFMGNILENSEQKFDMPSMALAAVGFTGIVLGVSNVGTYPIISLHVGLYLIVGIAALFVFCMRQLKLETPLLNIRVFKSKEFTVAVITCFALMALMNGMSVVVPILVQTVQGQSATVFGIIIAPCALIMGIMSPFTGRLYDKIGMRPLALIGCTCAFASKIIIVLMPETASTYMLIAPLCLLGFGLSFVMMNIVTYSAEALSGSEKTDSTALLACLRTMGGAIGAAAFAAMMTVGADDQNYTYANVRFSYIGMTVVAGIILLIAVLFIKKRKPQD